MSILISFDRKIVFFSFEAKRLEIKIKIKIKIKNLNFQQVGPRNSIQGFAIGSVSVTDCDVIMSLLRYFIYYDVVVTDYDVVVTDYDVIVTDYDVVVTKCDALGTECDALVTDCDFETSTFALQTS